MQTLIGLVIGLAFFIATVTAYCVGVKHGRTVKTGGIPNINPVKAVNTIRKERETKKQIDLFSEGMQNILNYGESFDKYGGGEN